MDGASSRSEPSASSRALTTSSIRFQMYLYSLASFTGPTLNLLVALL